MGDGKAGHFVSVIPELLRGNRKLRQENPQTLVVQFAWCRQKKTNKEILSQRRWKVKSNTHGHPLPHHGAPVPSFTHIQYQECEEDQECVGSSQAIQEKHKKPLGSEDIFIGQGYTS